MTPEKITSLLNNQLGKAKDFRYFALLASFVFFLDFSLIYFEGNTLSQITNDSLKDTFQLVKIVIFFTLFVFFMSFVVPLIQYALRTLTNAPVVGNWISSIFYYDETKNIKTKDYFLTYQLEWYAIRNKDTVAYDYYKTVMDEIDKDKQLEHYCLSLILFSLMDIYAYFINSKALVSTLFIMIKNNQDNFEFINIFIVLLLVFLYLFCFYFGVIRGCGWSFNTHNKIYFPDHGFKSNK